MIFFIMQEFFHFREPVFLGQKWGICKKAMCGEGKRAKKDPLAESPGV
jgi:hypothetical protein